MLNWIKKQIFIDEENSDQGLDFYRTRIFNVVSVTLLVTGFFALIAGILASIKYDLLIVAIFDIVAYGLLLFTFLNKSINIIIRKIYLISIPLILGIVFTFFIGPGGPGYAYLVGFCMLSAILLGLKATFYSLGIAIIVWLGLTASIYFNLFPDYAISNYSALGYFASGINIIVIGSISSLPLACLINQLESKIKKQNQLQISLEKNIAELEVSKAKAIESEQLKSRFLANMSHEIRTPLNAINGFSQLLIVEKNLEKEKRNEFLKIILDSGNYLLNVIENILDISLIEAKQFKYYIKPFKLNDFFLDIQQYYNEALRTNQVPIIFNLNLTGKPIIINSDFNRLKQVLINLINNAIKFTTEGKIEIAFNCMDDYIKFSVKDTGCGIDKELLDSIFNPFDKGNNGKFTEGTGLGLTISKEIVNSLGGDIWVKRNEDKGSCFYFSVPLNSNADKVNLIRLKPNILQQN